jgi:hypothetical protein
LKLKITSNRQCNIRFMCTTHDKGYNYSLAASTEILVYLCMRSDCSWSNMDTPVLGLKEIEINQSKEFLYSTISTLKHTQNAGANMYIHPNLGSPCWEKKKVTASQSAILHTKLCQHGDPSLAIVNHIVCMHVSVNIVL